MAEVAPHSGELYRPNKPHTAERWNEHLGRLFDGNYAQRAGLSKGGWNITHYCHQTSLGHGTGSSTTCNVSFTVEHRYILYGIIIW